MLVLGGGRSRAGSRWREESCWFWVEGGVVLVLGGGRSRAGSRWRNTKLLHTKTGYNGIYICPDRTAEQRKADNRLWEQLKAKRKLEPEKDHRIQNGRIRSSKRDSKPVVSNVG